MIESATASSSAPPDWPSGQFVPTAVTCGFVEHEGVPVAYLGNDDLLMVTGDPICAVTAANAYGLARRGGYSRHTSEDVEGEWVVFGWQPFAPDRPWERPFWLMSRAEPGDDYAVHVYRLPA